MLATVGVCLSWGVTALGMRYLAGWEWISALLFGALIAATDPVSVIATFKEAKIHGRLRLLVEAESLFNDGTAAVAFGVIVIAATGSTLSVSGVAETLAVSVAGGILCGGLIAGALLLLAGQTEDPLVEITLTTLAAYGSFVLAERFHSSGVLACLTAGLVVGNIGLSARNHFSPGKRNDHRLLGISWFRRELSNFHVHWNSSVPAGFRRVAGAVENAIPLVILGRALTVYPCCAVFTRSVLQIQGRHQHVLFWGGLRGGLALALALGLPPDVPNRETIIAVSFVVVAFSIFVQGLTMTPFLRKMGEMPLPTTPGMPT